jgi:hypothetical protein
VALGIGRAHRVGDLAHVDLQRVDAQVAQAGALGQPLGERIDIEHMAFGRVRHAHHSQALQRVLSAVGRGAAGDGALRLFSGNHTIGLQPPDQGAPVQRAQGRLGGSGGGWRRVDGQAGRWLGIRPRA